MTSRRTFLQAVSAWCSSLGLFGKAKLAPAPANAPVDPTGWTITWNDLESDKSLGYWLALPNSADRNIAFRVLVARPARQWIRINEREIPNDAQHSAIGEVSVDEGRGRRVYSDDIDWDEVDWDNVEPSFFDKHSDPNPFNREPTHYIIWDYETIPPAPEVVESAKQARRGRVIEMIQESKNGSRLIPYVGYLDNPDGERARIKPKGYVETVAMTPEERALDERRQAFDDNPPAFWNLVSTTFGELWHGSDYPSRVVCGYLAWKTIMGYYRERQDEKVDRIWASDLVLSKSLKLRQVSFENPNFPNDPKYNRIIEMPDEAYL